jgi:hypothetical protein
MIIPFFEGTRRSERLRKPTRDLYEHDLLCICLIPRTRITTPDITIRKEVFDRFKGSRYYHQLKSMTSGFSDAMAALEKFVVSD